MSSRAKRNLSKSGSSSETTNMASSIPARKRRKVEVDSSDEERSFWTPKHLGDLKAYNRSASEVPAELFRKDLISAMKLADNEPLKSEDYWGITDQWKQEWEQGVQVPVSPNSLPEASVTRHKNYPRKQTKFIMSEKLVRITHTDTFDSDKHCLSTTPLQAEKMCRYDMDNLDDSWLSTYNGERAKMGADPVPSEIFEHIIENLEETCWENIHKVLREEETDSIEHDEDVICDVCRSPDSEEGNEMVFCDTCNICVHQACYGITAIPSGSWICRTCTLGIKPSCVLCPNKGGAMKCTKNCQRWAHVACALWIPEVSIGSVERMEPITKITNIPQSRWSLVCVLCRERNGACIQCSVKSCKTAYHVTCAFKHGLEMKAIIEDENADDVKLRSYCEKHSRISKKDTCDHDSDNPNNSHKKKKDLSKEQSNHARAAKLRLIEAEFYKHVDVVRTSTILDIDLETTEAIFYYWKLKRRSTFNKPLLTPRVTEEVSKSRDNPLGKAHSTTRQHLERVRNLSYMVKKREKFTKYYLRMREQIFHQQCELLSNCDASLTPLARAAVMQANRSSSLYDRMGSCVTAPVHSAKDFEQIVKIIKGSLPGDLDSSCIKKLLSKTDKILVNDVNGLVAKKTSSQNPYRKAYFNGAQERRSRSSSQTGSSEASSTEESESSTPSTKYKPSDPGKKMPVFTSSEDEKCHSGPGAISKIKALLSSAEDSFSESKPPLLNTPRSGRGRGGPVRRGRGRPPLNKSRSTIKERKLFSSDEEKYCVPKDSKTFDALIKTSPSQSILHSKKLSYDSSEEDQPKKVFSPRSCKIKAPNYSSSEDESIPMKRSPGRGRGRARNKSKMYSKLPSKNPMQSWLPSTKSSDEDLAPAMYKLTSEDEEKSDVSKPGVHSAISSDSDRSRKSKSRKSDQTSSDSECDKGDSVGFLRTKGAVKEFAPKLEKQMEKMSRSKSVSRSCKKPSLSSKKKVIKSELDSGNDSAKESIPPQDLDTPSLSLVVPQRAAAKKASELITSQNMVPLAHPVSLATPIEPETKKIPIKSRGSGSESDSVNNSVEELKKSTTKTKKLRKEPTSDSRQTPKKNIFQTPEILPYVPLREAARKAAENLKGSTKVSLPEEIDSKLKKPKSEKVALAVKTFKQKSPRSCAKSSVAVTSDSDDETSLQKSVVKESVLSKDRGKSIFSESDEEPTLKEKKSEPTERNELPGKQQLFRGDVFVHDHQSSSEDDVTSLPKEKSSPSPQIRKKRKNSFRKSRAISDDELEVENKEPPATARRKAPDKKLKTSDGRPEHGFQPPVTQRKESTTIQQSGHTDASPVSAENKTPVRECGLERRSRAASGNVTKRDDVISSQITSSPVETRESRNSCKAEPAFETSQEYPNYMRGEVQSEETPLPKIDKIPEKGFKSTFQCVTPTKEETPLDVKLSTETKSDVFPSNDVTLSELSSQVQTKPKMDSDEDVNTNSLVKQPKDSGYKSSITTPEQPENTHDLSKTSPEDAKKPSESRGKYVSPGRRKNLQDVIEERTKMAELSGTRSQEPMKVPPINPVLSDIPEDTSDEANQSGDSKRSNSAGTSSFVEEWREQWVSSSPPSKIDHPDSQAQYPHIGISHHHSLPGVANMSEFPFMDLSGNSFHNKLFYYSQYVQLQYMRQMEQSGLQNAMDFQRLYEQLRMNLSAAQLQEVEQRRPSDLNFGGAHVPTSNALFSILKEARAAEERQINSQHKVDREDIAKDTVPFPQESKVPTTEKPVISTCQSSQLSCVPQDNVTHTVTTVHNKLSSAPVVSSASSGDVEFLVKVSKAHNVPSTNLSTKLTSVTSTTVSVSTSITESKVATSVLSSSPISTTMKTPRLSKIAYSPEIVDVEAIDSSPQLTKRVPIYMQETKKSRQSPRSNSSPRWTDKEKKKPPKSTRGRGRGRGRGAPKRGRGRRNAITVPKELVGTVYEFDDFDEFDSAPQNLRMMREKRQSVESTPQQSFTPTCEFKETPPSSKKTKEKKSKLKKHDDLIDSSVPTVSPLRDPLSLDEMKSSKSSGGNSVRKKMTPLPRAEYTATPVTSGTADDCTNQLKLKIKGPYANSCGSSALPVVVPQEPAATALLSAAPSSSKFRMIRKKELILQYCYQDQEPDHSDGSNLTSNPPHRSSISIPKAVASMPHIPTREDYKKYTQEDSPTRGTSSRRKKQPRELKQLNWSMKDDKLKRRDGSSPESSRKRSRTVAKTEDDSTKLRINLTKKSAEVVSIPICGKPPKKRLPDNMLMKVMNDNLKFREEIMKDFDDGSPVQKQPVDEKKNRKRRLIEDGTVDQPPNKLVFKLPKHKSIDEEATGRSTPNPAPHPLKMRLSLASLNKSDSCDSGETSAKNSPRDKDSCQPPLKLKLQRRREGYVTFSDTRQGDNSSPLGPDTGTSSPKDNTYASADLIHNPPTETPTTIHSPKEIEHKDRESLTDERLVSDAVMERLEAQLAAADDNYSQISYSTESSVPGFPLPVPNNDNPGCR